MLTAITGVYKEGKIFLSEVAPVEEETEVIVTFLKKEPKKNYAVRMGGPLKGKVKIPDNFNDPLEELNEYMY